MSAHGVWSQAGRRRSRRLTELGLNVFGCWITMENGVRWGLPLGGGLQGGAPSRGSWQKHGVASREVLLVVRLPAGRTPVLQPLTCTVQVRLDLPVLPPGIRAHGLWLDQTGRSGGYLSDPTCFTGLSILFAWLAVGPTWHRVWSPNVRGI